MKYELPTLNYNFNELEPYIDEMTMNIHYSKHHAAYINNLNTALEKFPELQEKSLSDLLSSLESIPESIRTAIRNNGGGHFNHSIFWSIMSPLGGGEPPKLLLNKIIEDFGSFDIFKEQFEKSALGRFGSGWVWLIISETGKLEIVSTPNQDSPILSGIEPILALDVWEHAYYLKYQNRRPDYVKAWWNIVDWKEVEKKYLRL